MNKTSFYLAKTNAYNSLLIINGFKWICYEGNNKGFQDGIDLYDENFCKEYKEKFIDSHNTEDFETLWNEATTQPKGEFEDLDEFIENCFESIMTIGEIEKN